MENLEFNDYEIDYIEIYTPMAKLLAYWHVDVLGFSISSYIDSESNRFGFCSYEIVSGRIRLILTSDYPCINKTDNDIRSFLDKNGYGVKKIAIKVKDLEKTYTNSLNRGGIPLMFPQKHKDDSGFVLEASIKLYDDCEILFIDRSNYTGHFKPGYKKGKKSRENTNSFLNIIDHISSQLRINESLFWNGYLSDILGTKLVQKFDKSVDNETGMLLHINQSENKQLTFVISEPLLHEKDSKIQKNIDLFGSGIHHIAFETSDILESIRYFKEKGVDFVSHPKSYYDQLRTNPDYQEVDIDSLQDLEILIDKENDSFLLQKFIKPISDRPYFFYEIVQRVNGYSGFALKNIKILKKAEDMEINNYKDNN